MVKQLVSLDPPLSTPLVIHGKLQLKHAPAAKKSDIDKAGKHNEI